MGNDTATAAISASVLDRLLDEDPRAGDPYLDILDLKDPAKIVGRMQGSPRMPFLHLQAQLLPEERQLLDSTDINSPVPNKVLLALIEGLNRVIRGPLLYERKRFETLKLSQDVVRLMEDGRRTTAVATLNRCLLDEIFAGDVHKMRRTSPLSTSIRELKQSVSRDIEFLLNTRRELIEEAHPQYKEVNNSLLMFGLPDFTSYSLMNTGHRKIVRQALEEALTKFEPRLKSVRVTLVPAQQFDAALHFRIDALLRVDPAPQPVTFDASLQLSTSAYRVRGDV